MRLRHVEQTPAGVAGRQQNTTASASHAKRRREGSETDFVKKVWTLVGNLLKSRSRAGQKGTRRSRQVRLDGFIFIICDWFVRPLLCSGPAASPRCERRGFLLVGGHAGWLLFAVLANRIEPSDPLHPDDPGGNRRRGAEQGLRSLVLAGRRLSILQILGVDLGGAGTSPAGALATEVSEVYGRGRDLVASYGQTSGRPLAVQIYWRSVDIAARLPDCQAVDLQVSVQTSLLDSNPELATTSTLPPGVVHRVPASCRTRERVAGWCVCQTSRSAMPRWFILKTHAQTSLVAARMDCVAGCGTVCSSRDWRKA